MNKLTKIFAGMTMALVALFALMPQAKAATVVVYGPRPYVRAVYHPYPVYPVYRAAYWLGWHNCSGTVTSSNGTVTAQGTCVPVY